MSEEFRILTLADHADWRAAWSRLPEARRDVFLRPEYYAACSDDAAAECAVFEREDSIVLHPYLRRPIHTLPWLDLDRECFDLECAYGYGGPASNTNDEGVWLEFFRRFSDYCRSTSVVAEFMRLHPLTANLDRLGLQYQIQTMNENVIVDLDRSEDEIWASYRQSARKNVNKARRNGVEVFFEGASSEHFEDFIRIYHHTLDRRAAADSYRFPPRFYQTLHRLMPDGLIYCFARWNGEIVSTELCLISEDAMYSFLGGTLDSAFDVRPNNLLKHELILFGRKKGLKKFVLGGGSERGDGIFEYKKTFAPEGVKDFFIGKRVHDAAMYARLLESCAKAFDPDTRSRNQWFLRWRYPVGNAIPSPELTS